MTPTAVGAWALTMTICAAICAAIVVAGTVAAIEAGHRALGGTE